MPKPSTLIILLTTLLLPTIAHAKIDLVTLPVRDQVQLTIYNAADLTYVREQRTLTLKTGINRLEFGWVDTLIDPTSVHLTAPQHAEQVNLIEVTYPPNVTGSAIWTIDSKIAGEIPVVITFFTSGLSWRAFYMGTLATDEKTMRLQNYVQIQNQSGEDYLNAQTRVVVGTVHLLDQIAELARRSPPYGMPIGARSDSLVAKGGAMMLAEEKNMDMKSEGAERAMAKSMAAPKEIVKEGLSEYFLYTIEGTESILNGWGKRLLSLEIADIPVRALYRYDEHRYGRNTEQLLYFKNDEAHHLGKTPLPNGNVTIYRQLSEQQHLTYVGAMNIQYIPVGQEVELDLGAARQVKVEPILMNYKTANYLFDNKGNISGFDKIQQWQLKLANNRDLPIDLEIFQPLPHPYWKIDNAPDLKGQFEKVDVDTIKYTLTLPAHTKEYFLTYTMTLFEGERQQQH
jgi:hypothetical protein